MAAGAKKKRKTSKGNNRKTQVSRHGNYTIALNESTRSIVIAAILVASAAFMFYRAGDSFSGYLGFNEGYYTNLAVAYSKMPLFKIITAPLDFNNPPLYVFALTLFFKILGATTTVARLVSIIFSTAAVYFTYKLGRLVYNDFVGLLGALFLALTPAFQLVGRNVQLEAPMLFFVLASLYFYIKSLSEEGENNTIVAGVLMGFGLLTKLPVIIVFAGIVLWHLLSKQWNLLFRKRFYLFSALTFLIGFSWFAYQAIFQRQAFGSSQGYLAGTIAFPDISFLKDTFLIELFWALSPVVFIIAIVAVIFKAIELSKSKSAGSEGLLMTVLSLFTILYLFYHYHSYYMLPMFPLLLLFSADFMGSRIKDARRGLSLIHI
jgi:4-amino-4-deoxy-L-arabinose transferase-like glycosyltransferase